MDWDLNGYGAFVWPSYGLWVLVIGGLIVQSLRAHARLKRQVQHAEHRARAREETSQ